MWSYEAWKANEKGKITKALFMAAVGCPRALYNMLYNSEVCAEPKEDLTIKYGMQQLSEMIWAYFEPCKVNIISEAKFAQMCKETKDMILMANAEKPFIYGGAFASNDGCVCKTSWMEVKANKALKLYSFHINTESSEDKKLDEQLWNLAYQWSTIEKSGAKVENAIIMLIDREYRKPKRGQDAKKLFLELDVSKMVQHIVKGIPLADEDGRVICGQVSVDDILAKIREMQELAKGTFETIENAAPPIEMCANCLEPHECPCFADCKAEKGVADSIIWNIAGLRKNAKFMLANLGYDSAASVLFGYESGDVKLNPKQVRQLEYEIDRIKVERAANTAYPYTPMPKHVERKPIVNWMENEFGEYEKVYFLDFETFQFAIPKWRELAPYEKVPFQFSLHVWNRYTRELEHFEFLAQKGKDPRETCAKLLCEYIPKDVPVVAYNAGFEKSVMNALGEKYPEYASHLENIVNNVHDLMKPFQAHWYYRVEFKGKYSIKFVLPGLFPNDETLDYHNLEEIQNGVMAMDGYLRLQEAKGREGFKTRKNMLAYCALDTFAMVKIFWYIETLIMCDFDEDQTIREMEQYNGYSAQMAGTLPTPIVEVEVKPTKKKVV